MDGDGAALAAFIPQVSGKTKRRVLAVMAWAATIAAIAFFCSKALSKLLKDHGFWIVPKVAVSSYHIRIVFFPKIHYYAVY